MPGCVPGAAGRGDRHQRADTGLDHPSARHGLRAESTAGRGCGEAASSALRSRSGSGHDHRVRGGQHSVRRVRVHHHRAEGQVRAQRGACWREPAGHCDKIQEQLGEGPCLESAIEQTTIRIDDMDSDTRWPLFTDAASALGVKSMICFQLYVEGVNFGALNLHSTRTDAFSPEAESIGSLFAAHAAIAFSTAREEQQIRAALTSRDLIGQAKGMLMERYNLNSQAAFALLAKLSQDTNVKLADLAAELVADAAKSTR
ncbi:MAG: GAF and ANTAR domain-containing protein [Rhodococcus sp. (in: high G+C Gram-positive bacteria)]|nr:GAF and ANTAR domain-containing protein [Rhodococcus sp. (in: high G+C Gram-positive bacteria)]